MKIIASPRVLTEAEAKVLGKRFPLYRDRVWEEHVNKHIPFGRLEDDCPGCNPRGTS